MRAAIYLRNSDPRQAVRGTDDGQLAAGQETARRLEAEVVAVYADRGISAKTGNLAARGDFARLRAEIKTLRLDVVIVANVDRLTRTESFRELGEIFGPLQDAGVRIAIAGGGIIDLNSGDGMLNIMFESWRSARENAARRDRTLRGRARTAVAGRPPGLTPWGIAYVPGEGWKLTEMAAIVREMFERVAKGEATEAIAADLHRRGIPTPRKMFRGQKVRWRRSTVYDLVVRDCYRGQWRANRETTIKVPAIIDDRLWAAAQEALMEARRRGLRRTRHHYLLEGLGRCELCRGRINIRMSSDPRWKTRYHYYVCANRYRGAYGERCTLPLFRIDEVDARVWAAVSEFVARPDLVADAVARRDGAAGADALRAAVDLEGWRRQLERLVEAEGDTLALFRRGVVSREARDAELTKIAQQRRMLEQQVEAAQKMAASAVSQQQSVADIAGWLGKLRERLEGAEPEVRRGIVRAVVPGRGDYFFVLGPEKIVGRALLGSVAATGQSVEMRIVA